MNLLGNEHMTDLIIEGTKDSLDIKCTSGSITITGNSILPNPIKFFKPVFEWVEEYVKDPADRTEITIKIEYTDTASVQSIFNLLKALKSIPEYESRLVVNWYFEFDDPELLEVGEIMEGRLNITFNYLEYNS